MSNDDLQGLARRLAPSLAPHLATLLMPTGTFTPTLAGSSTPGTFTYTNQDGRYTRIGNRVIFDLRVVVNTVSGSPAGDLRIGGLPFTAGSGQTYNGSVWVKFLNSVTLLAGTRVVGGTVEAGHTYCRIAESPSAGSASYLPATAVTAGSWIVIGGEYEL